MGQTMERCKHKLHSIPDWSDEGRQTMIENIFKDRQEDFFREAMGYNRKKENNCFNHTMTLEIFSKPRRSLEDVVHHVFIAIDPCAGSDNIHKQTSDYAIIAMCNPGLTIIGMEAMNAALGSSHVDNTVVNFIRKIRAHPLCNRAYIVFACEHGTGMEANRMYSMVMDSFENVIIMSSTTREHGGMKINNDVKQVMMEGLNRSINQRKISICRDFITSDPNPASLLEKLKKQLLAFERVYKEPKNRDSKASVTWNGKGPNHNQPDDLSIVLQWGVEIYTKYWTSGNYTDTHINDIAAIQSVCFV
jgi:hypothetical protein